ncbi:PIN-like domain-containing protein [Undibacterium sp. Tian12W]|uniref:PIN-like domain-containing protein n=1 Tax=Undibacterium sp. Tian12W TaxID=3413054 RepID=UPI003BF2F3A6
MRDLFPGHYLPNKSDFKNLWENATFIFDTNVLLHLYRYPDEARNSLLSALSKLGSRIWIPYHVAFEFHQNRFEVIVDSNASVNTLSARLKSLPSELRSDFKKIDFERRSTGISDINSKLEAAETAIKDLEHAVKIACQKLPNLSMDDAIGDQIADLFQGKTGRIPANQEDLNTLYADGESRYDANIPPGFGDKAKAGEFKIRPDLSFPDKYGDLVIWRQTMDYVKKSDIKQVVFVTSDAKSDWWWIFDKKQTKKTLGPNPKLVSEFLENTNAEKFWMYSGDDFLKYAGEYLSGFAISEETLAQVKQVAEKETLEAAANALNSMPVDWTPFSSSNWYPTSTLINDQISLYNQEALIDWLRRLHNQSCNIAKMSDTHFIVYQTNYLDGCSYQICITDTVNSDELIAQINHGFIDHFKSVMPNNQRELIVISRPLPIKKLSFIFFGGLLNQGEAQAAVVEARDFAGFSKIRFIVPTQIGYVEVLSV